MKLKHVFQTAQAPAAPAAATEPDTAAATEPAAENPETETEIETAPETTATIEVPVKTPEAPPVATGPTPFAMFAIGLTLFAMFVAYFAIEDQLKKRIVGALLTAGVTALSLFYLFSLGVNLAIDLAGGSQFVVQIQPSEGASVSKEDQAEVINTFQKRLDPDGQKNLMIAPQGNDRVIIQMPGISDEERERTKTIIKKTAKLDIVLVHPDADNPSFRNQMLNTSEGEVILGYEVVEGYEGDVTKKEIVQRGVSVSGEHVTNAFINFGPKGWEIHVKLDNTGGKIMNEITFANVGKRMAMLVDGQNLSAPVINEPFGANFVISGDFKRDEAELLATMLKNPLGNEVKILHETSVSPEMGDESVKQGLVAGFSDWP